MAHQNGIRTTTLAAIGLIGLILATALVLLLAGVYYRAVARQDVVKNIEVPFTELEELHAAQRAKLQAAAVTEKTQTSPTKPSGSFWLPPPMSTSSESVDGPFHLILRFAGFFMAHLVMILLLLLVRYRRRPGVEPAELPRRQAWLGVFGIVATGGVVVFIFWHGFEGFMDMRTPPPSAYPISVAGSQQAWRFSYPEGAHSDVLHVPVGRPVRLDLQSGDVRHGLFIPAFRVRMDAVPGRENTTWFEAIAPGEYDLYCAEHCGMKHSPLGAKVVVHASGGFDEWLVAEAGWREGLSREAIGEELLRRKGCSACHSIDGSPLAGPTFSGIFGAKREFTNAEPLDAVDESYLRESIENPAAKIRKGFEPVMPNYSDPTLSIREDDLDAIVAYLKSVK